MGLSGPAPPFLAFLPKPIRVNLRHLRTFLIRMLNPRLRRR